MRRILSLLVVLALVAALLVTLVPIGGGRGQLLSRLSEWLGFGPSVSDGGGGGGRGELPAGRRVPLERAPPPGSTPLVVELVEPPATHYGEHAWTEADRKYAQVISGVERGVYDPALGHAARELAAFYALEDVMAPGAVVRFVLAAAGAAEWDVRRSFLATPRTDDDTLARHVGDLVRAELARSGAGELRLGVGEAYTLADPGRRYVAVLLSAGELVLRPVPRSVRPGDRVRVSGELPPRASRPTLRVMGPDLEIRTVAPEVGGEAFDATVDAGLASGPLWIEIIAETPGGPRPLAQLEIEVGGAPPVSLRALWPPDEPADMDAARAEDLAAAYLAEDRERFGLPVLARDADLDAVARAHSRDMRDHGFFGHRSPTTGSVGDRLRAAGYRHVGCAENIARNPNLWDAERGLFESLGHRANILSSRLDRLGLGVAVDEEDGRPVLLLTQVFARPVAVVDPAAAREEVETSFQRARDLAGRGRLMRHEGLDDIAAVVARAADPSPRAALDGAKRRGLGRQGAWAQVVRVSELSQVEVPDEVRERSYRRLGLGIHQDLDAEPPAITVVVILSG